MPARRWWVNFNLIFVFAIIDERSRLLVQEITFVIWNSVLWKFHFVSLIYNVNLIITGVPTSLEQGNKTFTKSKKACQLYPVSKSNTCHQTLPLLLV
jgi:hypothetical protein